MPQTTYVPIDCHFYDVLESAAVKKLNSTLTYLDESNKEQIREGLIVDFIHINKAEYLVLKDGFKLRLDKLIKLNDRVNPITSTCAIKG
ncbi:MAG: hypothetical protein HRT43_10820 [Campylobacteraceae bacterium]|nr:hypothetical protein [Campylobacteraceae bacterium]